MNINRLKAAIDEAKVQQSYYESILDKGSSRKAFLQKEYDDAKRRLDQFNKDVGVAPSRLQNLQRTLDKLKVAYNAARILPNSNVDPRTKEQKAVAKVAILEMKIEENFLSLSPEERAAYLEMLEEEGANE